MTTIPHRHPDDAIGESLTRGWQLPAWMYSDPTHYTVEKQKILDKAWYCVGRENQLAEAGCFLTAEIGDLPIVVVRGRDGALHGHVNVCRHRLHPVAEGAGCRQLLQCRYHGWTYTTDGSLRSAPGLQDEDEFDRQTMGLRPVLVDTLLGFVFANPDVGAPPLREFIGDALPQIDSLDLGFADWDFGGTFTYDVPANWKLFTENALECYHCPLVHETTFATVFETAPRDYVCTEYGNVAIQAAPATTLAERLADRSALDGFRFLYLWPVTSLSVDDVSAIVARVVPRGPREVRFVVDTYVRPGTDPTVLRKWLDLYDQTFAEDKAVVAAQQAGYDCNAVPQGRLMTGRESTIAMFHRRTWAALTDAPTDVPTESTGLQSNPILPPVPPGEVELAVESMTTVAEEVVELTLRSPGGNTLPRWEPGAHIELALPEGRTRQYSLCGDPDDQTRWRIAVLRAAESRGGSTFIHDEITTGSTIRVRGPRNHFPMPDAESFLFVVGGIGITPIMPMITEAERRGKEWTLLYGGRKRASMAFLSELECHGGRVTIRPQDTDGMLDLEAAIAGCAPGTVVLACGPGPMLDALADACAADDRVELHLERFTATPTDPGPRTAFSVELARTGATVAVDPDESVLDAVRGAGADVRSSCREGICGSCETTVLAGRPDHRDHVLTDEERRRSETMMICVSRCEGDRLVLDL